MGLRAGGGGELTSIRVLLGAVAVLEAVVPGALVPGAARLALPDPIPALEAVRPLAPVNPAPLGLQAQAVPLALRPVAAVGVAAGPGVDADYLEAVVPGARVLALALGAGADTVAVRLAAFPSSTVRPSIVEIKSSSTHA